MSTPTLQLVGARRTFSSGRRTAPTPALAGVDLSVNQSEILVVVGPSGSGKTTLLRALAGLETLDAGQVLINGNDVTPPGARDLAFVFQDLALLPHLNVADNIGFGERARGASRAVVRSKVHAAAEAFGLTAALARRPHQLSGGERQRVALARAMVREPVAFLMDEPLASLDPQLRDRARDDIRALQQRLGVPLVYVTHDPHEALSLGDRLVVLKAGVVVQVGDPDSVYARPVDTFVASFIGPLPMNLMPVGDDLVGVRPERMSLVPVAGAKLIGVVERVAHAGDEATAHLTRNAGAPPVVVRLPWSDRPEAGATVSVSWDETDEHHFDPSTGKRR